MTSQRISLTLDIAGRLAPSLSQAFGRAGGMFGGISRQVADLTREERRQREELQKVARARKAALDAGQDVANYDRQVRRLNDSLAETTSRLRDATEQEARRQRVFAGVAVAGAAVVGAVAGGAALTGQLVAERSQRAREIQRESGRAGTDAESVQQLGNLLEAANRADRGGGVELAADVLREAQVRAADFESGSIAEAFDFLGLDQRGFAERLNQDSSAAILETLGPALRQVAETQGGARAQFLAGEVLGDSEAERILPLLLADTQELADARERAARAPFYTEEQIAVLLDADHATRRLSQAWGGLADELTLEAAPATAAVRNRMAEAVESTTQWVGENEKLAAVLGTAFGAISGVGGLLAGLAPVLIGIPPLISLVTAAWGALNLAFLFSPIGLIIGGIVLGVGLLAGAAYVVYRNWDTILAALTRAWGGVQEAVGNVIESIQGKWNDLVSIIFDTFRTVIEPVLNALGAVGGALGFDTSALDTIRETIDAAEGRLTFGEPATAGATRGGDGATTNISQTNYIDVSGVDDADAVVQRVGDEIAERTAR